MQSPPERHSSDQTGLLAAYAIIAAEALIVACLEVLRRRGILVTASMLCAILSCRSTQPPVVAVIPETTAQELWESEHAGAEKAAKALGWSVYWNAPSREDDLPRQIQIIDKAIQRKVAGLILSPDHDVALISPVRSALAHGIPTVIVGSPLGIAPGGDLSFVLNDDEIVGKLAAERLHAYLKPGDAVAILGVNPNILSHMHRTAAIVDSLLQASPHLHIVERRSTSFAFAEAEETAEETIRSTPHLRAIVALDITQTRGAYFALMEEHAHGRVVLIGCDQDLDLVRQVRAGTIDAIIAENTFAMGYEAMQQIASLRSGRPVKAQIVIAPILITRHNVDVPAVQKVLDMNWGLQ